MNFGSVCSGIEAASCAWAPIGWKAAFVSEIETFPRAVLAHHYPDVPNLGDMTKFKEWNHHDIDVLVGGTPCQSFSVAGLRKGLDDPRGNLMLTYLAIADRYRPEWLVWENVPGVLSSNGGKDFGTFLGGLAELGYGFAYRVLDAQYFGVAQRRRRVFVVGCLGDWRRAAAVLFERDSLSGNPAPSRQERKDVAHDIAPCLTNSGRGVERIGDTRGQDPVIACRVTHSLHADVSPALKARDSKGPSSDGDGDGAILVPMVSHSLRGDGFDASEDGTGRGTPIVTVAGSICRDSFTGGAGGRPEGAAAGNFVPVAFDCKASGQNGFGVGDISSTLRAMGHAGSHQNGGGHLAVAAFKAGQGSKAGGIGYDCNVSPTLSAADSGTNRTPALMQGMQVRRLTPVECERLQGLTDNYTRIPTWNGWRNMDADETPEQLIAEGFEVKQNKKTGKWRVKDVDGPRYKALGNSMAVPVMRWIGERIQMVSQIAEAA